MNHDQPHKTDSRRAADLLVDAGGTIVGRTRLQKLAYLLEVAGLGVGFEFSYRHYGPYSERLAVATHNAVLLGLVAEEERPASWGGSYSVFTLQPAAQSPDRPSSARAELAKVAIEANSVALELAATAVFLHEEGCQDPWEETARRKPEKAKDGRLDEAKELYRSLARVKTPKPLPGIV